MLLKHVFLLITSFGLIFNFSSHVCVNLTGMHTVLKAFWLFCSVFHHFTWYRLWRFCLSEKALLHLWYQLVYYIWQSTYTTLCNWPTFTIKEKIKRTTTPNGLCLTFIMQTAKKNAFSIPLINLLMTIKNSVHSIDLQSNLLTFSETTDSVLYVFYYQ